MSIITSTEGTLVEVVWVETVTRRSYVRVPHGSDGSPATIATAAVRQSQEAARPLILRASVVDES